MADVLFRCSALGLLMTEPVQVDDAFRTPEVDAIIAKKKRDDDEKALLAALKLKTLSVGAKTFVRQIAAQDIFGVDFEVSSKHMEKGILVELESIALLNRVRGLALQKNTERRSNEWIAGECDLFDAERRRGHDVKSSWSFATFPICETDCIDKIYEWQARGYMALWDADEWEVDFCLISTPEHLIGFEPVSMHFCDHIPEHMRVTSWTIKRDAALEESMVAKVKAARAYYLHVVEEFDRAHPALVAA